MLSASLLTRVHCPRILAHYHIRVSVAVERPLVVDADHVSVDVVVVIIIDIVVVVVGGVVAGPVVGGGPHARGEGVEEVELGAGLAWPGGPQLAGAPHWREPIGRGVQDTRAVVELVALVYQEVKQDTFNTIICSCFNIDLESESICPGPQSPRLEAREAVQQVGLVLGLVGGPGGLVPDPDSKNGSWNCL